MNTDIKLEPVLNRAQCGLVLARTILEHLSQNREVTVDFSAVESITPSFSNAFVMTLLHERSLDEIRERVHMVNRTPLAAKSISNSVKWYQQGLRLTTQQEAYA
jgi:hypothetical protein